VGDIRGDNRAISILISKSKYCLKIFNDGMNIQQHGGIWKVIMLLVMTSEGKGAMHK
jgi:hypothetical protein